MVQCSWFKVQRLQSSVRPTLKRQCFPLISLIPNPTSEAHEFYVLHVLYKYLPT